MATCPPEAQAVDREGVRLLGTSEMARPARRLDWTSAVTSLIWVLMD